MLYTAIYKDENKILHSMIQSDYSNKRDFEKDLRRNGYVPIIVLTERQIKLIKENEDSYFDKLAKQKGRIALTIYDFVRECI